MSEQTVYILIRLLLRNLHCLPFSLHLLEELLDCKIILFYIKDSYGSKSRCPNF